MRLQLILLLGLVVISATADERIKRPSHRRPTHRLSQVRRRPPPPPHVALQAIPYPSRRSKSLAPGKAPKAPVQAAKKPTASVAAKRPSPPKVAKAAPRQAVLRQSLQQIQQNFAANSARPQGPSIGSIRQQLGIQQVRLPPRAPTLTASPTNALNNVRSNFNSLRTRLNGAGLRFRQRLPSVGQRFRNAFGTSAAAAAAVPPALRRNSKLPPVFFKKAEDIPGYTKFTLDDVIVDKDSSEVINPRNPLNSADSILARSDNGDDITLVDTNPKKPQSPPAAKREEAATTNETEALLENL